MMGFKYANKQTVILPESGQLTPADLHFQIGVLYPYQTVTGFRGTMTLLSKHFNGFRVVKNSDSSSSTSLIEGRTAGVTAGTCA